MVIPPRDWLLLRGRMRAVAKVAVLPVLLKTATASDIERRDDEPPSEPVEAPSGREA